MKSVIHGLRLGNHVQVTSMIPVAGGGYKKFVWFGTVADIDKAHLNVKIRHDHNAGLSWHKAHRVVKIK